MTPKMFLRMWQSGKNQQDKNDMKQHLLEVIATAVAAERERCAKVAESYSTTFGDRADKISAAIRTLK